MVFVKSFPRTLERQGQYPQWEEMKLTDEEEREQELLARIENLNVMKECIWDVRELMKEKNLKPFQSDIVSMAVALFEKRASHGVFWKERKCRDKFDVLYTKGRQMDANQTNLAEQAGNEKKPFYRKKAANAA